MSSQQDTKSSTINNINRPCLECNSIHHKTKQFVAYTKKAGYYCDNCIQIIKLEVDLYRREHETFWAVYPNTDPEMVKTF